MNVPKIDHFNLRLGDLNLPTFEGLPPNMLSPAATDRPSPHRRIFSYRKSPRWTPREQQSNPSRESLSLAKKTLLLTPKTSRSNRTGSSNTRRHENSPNFKIKYYGPINTLCREGERGRDSKKAAAPSRDTQNFSPCNLELSSIIEKISPPSRFHDRRKTQLSNAINGTVITLKHIEQDTKILDESVEEVKAKKDDVMGYVWVRLLVLAVIIQAVMLMM